MLRLTKKADYGLMALKFLAEHSDETSLSAKDIAEAYHIPPQLLAKILQRLAKVGILRSHAGMNGGYSLLEVRAGDFGVRGHPRYRRAAVHHLLRAQPRRLRPDRQLHHQRAAGARQRQHLRPAAQHQHRRPGRPEHRSCGATETRTAELVTIQL